MLAHRDAEGGSQSCPPATSTSGRCVRRFRRLTDWRDWTPLDGWRRPRRGRSGALVRYSFSDTGLHLVFRPRQATDEQSMPAVVSPDIARAAGGVGATTDARLRGHADRRAGRRRRQADAVDAGGARLVRARRRGVALDRARRRLTRRGHTPGGLDLGRRGGALRARRSRPSSSPRGPRRSASRGDPLAHATAVALGAAASSRLCSRCSASGSASSASCTTSGAISSTSRRRGSRRRTCAGSCGMRGVILLVVGISGRARARALALAARRLAGPRLGDARACPSRRCVSIPTGSSAALGVAALLLAALLVAERRLARRLPRRASRARVLEPRMTPRHRRPRGIPDPPARRGDVRRAPGADARRSRRARSSSCSGRAARGRRRCCGRSPGFDTLSAGVARVLGVDVGALGPGAAARFRAENLGLLDQHYARALSPDLTCVHTVGLGLELPRPPAARGARRRRRRCSSASGSATGSTRGPAALSGGEQQRVAALRRARAPAAAPARRRAGRRARRRRTRGSSTA